MKKILFLIHDLGPGGAEKVLVNLVNNLDREKFDISLLSLFGGGVNERFLAPDIHYRAVFRCSFPANSHIMKLFSPKMLHKLFIKEHYDIEISYLEGPSARVISGSSDPDTKLVSWIHIEHHTKKRLAASFRSFGEAVRCYGRFDMTACVSRDVMNDFCKILDFKKKCMVLYNTNESAMIAAASTEPVYSGIFSENEIKLVGVGKLLKNKGFDRMARITKRLRDEGYPVHFYALGEGPMRDELEQYARDNDLKDSFTLLGYQTNPYKYVAKCDLFVCASLREGFSTAATEALIVGTPVCTVDVSGMREMLGDNNEWGVVTENDENALYLGIKSLLDAPEKLAFYKKKAFERGKTFATESTVRAVEDMLTKL